jgi:thymidylate synthase
MRIYSNPMEMIREVEREMTEMAIGYQSATVQDKDVSENPEFWTNELQGYTYAISDIREGILFPDTGKGFESTLRYMNLSIGWANCEFAERISSTYINPGEAYAELSGLWEPYLHDGRFSYTYNERFREQLSQILDELKKRPNTRQAVLTMYDRHQDLGNRGGLARVPCSMSTQFLIRNGKLDSLYVMRSCDFIKHFAYDVYLACRLQEYVAEQLGLGTGKFVHFIGSLHAFKKDIDARGSF